MLSFFALALILGLITILWATLANGAQAASGRSGTGSVYQGLHRVTVLPGQTLPENDAMSWPEHGEGEWAEVERAIEAALRGKPRIH